MSLQSSPSSNLETKNQPNHFDNTLASVRNQWQKVSDWWNTDPDQNKTRGTWIGAWTRKNK